MITTMTQKNQITIRAQLVKELNLQPGMRLQWSVDEQGRLLAQPLPPRGGLGQQAAGAGSQEGADPVGDLIQMRAKFLAAMAKVANEEPLDERDRL